MKKCDSYSISKFKYPSRDKLSSRTSTICRSMACTLVERKACSLHDEEKWKKFFCDDKCAYCGKEATHLDHLYPLIKDRKPTGYGTEPSNLVPCCNVCNQAKGNVDWEEFMKSSKCKHQPLDSSNDLSEAITFRIKKIKEFQTLMPAKRIEVTQELLIKWEEILNSFDNALSDAELEISKLKSKYFCKIKE